MRFAGLCCQLCLLVKVIIMLVVLTQPVVADSFVDWYSSPISQSVPSPTSASWKFSHPAPPVSPLMPIMRQGLDLLVRQSQEKFTYKEYGGGVLHGQLEVFRALRRGISDYALCYGSLEANGFEYTKALTQFGVAAKNPLVTTRILAELAPRYFAAEFEAKGVYYSASVASAPSRILTKKPVHNINDLKGLKLITHGIPAETAKHYGYTPINIAFTETDTALQQGIVDGVIGIDPAFIAFKLYEQANYLTLVDIASGAVDLCINRKSFDRLSSQNKATFYSIQQPLMMAIAKKAVSDLSERANEVYTKHGVELITPTPEETKQWNSVGLASRAPWISSCKKQGKDCVALLKDIEQLKQKYNNYTDDALMDLAIQKPVTGIISTYNP